VKGRRTSSKHLELVAGAQIEQSVIRWALRAARLHRRIGQYRQPLGWRDRLDTGHKHLLADLRLL